MSDDNLSMDSEICRLLSCVPEKFVVDFANGIDVVRERQRYMAGRTSFFSRLHDGFTGQDGRHQAEINASLTDSVEGALKWLTDLSESLAMGNFATRKVNQRVNALKLDVARVADYAFETRQSLDLLSQRLELRCGALEGKVARIDSLQKAHLHIEEVFGKWATGRFHCFSLSGRCYAALEELRWGAFGDYCRESTAHECQQQLELLSNRAVVQLSLDAGLGPGERIGTRDRWLAKPPDRHLVTDADDALGYLGDWADPGVSPFSYTVTQRPQDLPLQVPLLGSARRFTETLIGELFLEVPNG